jgi:hypothetical protein
MTASPAPLRLARAASATEEPYRSWAQATDLLRLVAEITVNIAKRNAGREMSALAVPCREGGPVNGPDDDADGEEMITACIRPTNGGVR